MKMKKLLCFSLVKIINKHHSNYNDEIIILENHYDDNGLFYIGKILPNFPTGKKLPPSKKGDEIRTQYFKSKEFNKSEKIKVYPNDIIFIEH